MQPSKPNEQPLEARVASSQPQPSPPARYMPPPPQPQSIVIYAPTWFQRWTGRLGWIGCFFLGFLLVSQWVTLGEYFDTTGDVTEKFHSGEKYGSDKVAVIRVSGVILEGEGYIKHQIDQIREDKNVKAVVLRVDSPGGTVTGSDYIFHHLKKLRNERKIPLVVSMGSIAASGGYYVSMAVGDQKDVIFAEPTTTTGSIGVIIPHYDVSKLLERYDVKDDSISSHPRKQMLSMTRQLSEEDRKLVQSYVDESFQRFTEIVKEGRPLFSKDGDALKQLATGEIFSANQAHKHGLVDKIGFIEDAIDRAIELARLDKEHVRVVEFERPVSLFNLGFAQATAGRSELATLLELSSPRAYYLATSLPTLITSRRAD